MNNLSNSNSLKLLDAIKEINRLNRSVKFYRFTKREKQILKLIAKGKTDKEIANDLFISIKTAKKHRTNILHKAEVKNSAELVAMAVENGIC